MRKFNFFPIMISAVLVLLWISCINSSPQAIVKQDEGIREEIDRILQRIYENEQFSGTVMVSIKGEIIYKKGFGYADIIDSVPNASDTKFRIASFTKPFTVMLILQLVEEGKLKMDGKLTDYLPEFPKEKGDKITINHLLTHTAGITGESRILNLIDIEKLHYTREELLNCIAKRDLIYEPGKGNEYSNFGYALLGLIIERVTGLAYDEVLLEKICKPAGMKNTLSDDNSRDIENRAIGYTYNYFTGWEESSFLDMSFTLGSGQLLSTVEDLYLFDKALYSNILLSEKSKQFFFNRSGWRFTRYPYGKGTKRVLSNSLDGSINGFQSHTHRISQDTIFIVALRNIKEAIYENEIVIKWPSTMMSRILAIIYGEEYDLPRKSAAFSLFKTLIDSEAKSADDLSMEISKISTDRFYFDENEFSFFEDELRKAGMEKKLKEYKEIRQGGSRK